MKLSEHFQYLDKTVAYYPRLSHFLGSVKEALFLSQLAYWEGKQWDKKGWIRKSREQFWEETGLSRNEQETARRRLKTKGYLEESYRFIPRTTHYKVNWDKINNDWNEWLKNSSWRKTYQQDGGPDATHVAETPPAITESTKENKRDYVADEIRLHQNKTKESN